jgi:hypothetical protein
VPSGIKQQCTIPCQSKNYFNIIIPSEKLFQIFVVVCDDGNFNAEGTVYFGDSTGNNMVCHLQQYFSEIPGY